GGAALPRNDVTNSAGDQAAAEEEPCGAPAGARQVAESGKSDFEHLGANAQSDDDAAPSRKDAVDDRDSRDDANGAGNLLHRRRPVPQRPGAAAGDRPV